MSEPAPPESAGRAGQRRQIRAVVGFIIGIVLLAAAAWAVVSQRDALQQARDAVRGAPLWLIAAGLLLPVLNWLVISAAFWVMMRRYGRVTYGEMVWLIAAAWLLNYLPLRAGMVGRIAYHRTVNNIRIADSLRVTVFGLAFAAIAMLVMLLAAVLLAANAPWQLWAATLGAPPLAAAACAGWFGLRGSANWWLPAAFGLRYLDSLLWVLRYTVVFTLVGSSIRLSGAVAVSVVSQVTILVPIVPNGLGLREWAVGLTAAALPPSLLDAQGQIIAAIGVAADLVNRALELIIALPVGLCATWLLARRRRSPNTGSEPPDRADRSLPAPADNPQSP